MSRDLTPTTANKPSCTVTDLLLEYGFHQVPVLNDGELIGVITPIFDTRA
jgi:CBS domain-containing protein